MNGTPEEAGPVCRRRGRPRRSRAIEGSSPGWCLVPACCSGAPDLVTTLTRDEIALLELIDLKGLQQEEAALALGVSRRTIWRDLHEARRKVAEALVKGQRIEIEGCQRRASNRCPRCRDNLPISDSMQKAS